MGKVAPVGTIRHWQNGDFIKAHEGVHGKTSWIPVKNNPELRGLGATADSMAGFIISKKEPIDGKIYLDHELDEFEKQEGDFTGPYPASNFQQYAGFYGASRYSFTNEFHKLWMNKYLKLEELIADELRGMDKDQITDGVVKDIRQRIKLGMDWTSEGFDIKDARKVVSVVSNVYDNMKKGVDFEGDEKLIYDQVSAIINQLPERYIPIKQALSNKTNALNLIKDKFTNNWGLVKTFEKRADDKYTSYLKNFKSEIQRDYLQELSDKYGLDTSSEINEFYKTVKNISESEEYFDFKTLVSLRFAQVYDKSVEGDWGVDNMDAMQAMEHVMKTMPAGHFLTNSYLNAIGSSKYNSGGGYAYYSSKDRIINLSPQAVNSVSRIGNLTDTVELDSVISHEIGHAVSRKFRDSKNIEYKRFGVLAGWSFQQDQLSNIDRQATGNDRDIPRHGSNSDVPLITEYSRKSPEECFAEYYSMYHLNKKDIDNWLETGDLDNISQKSKWKTGQSVVTSDISRFGISEMDTESFNKIKNFADYKLGPEWVERYTGTEIVDHKDINITNSARKSYDAESAKRLINRIKPMREGKEPYYGSLTLPLAFTDDGSRFHVVTDSSMMKAFHNMKIPASLITIKGEAYRAFKEKGYNEHEIKSFIYTNLSKKGHVAEMGQRTESELIRGFSYRAGFVDVRDVDKNKALFKQMKRIYESDELKKAIENLFKGKHYKQVQVKGKKSIFTRKQLVGSNDITDYFNNLAKMTEGSSQGDYYKFQADSAKPIEITPLHIIYDKFPEFKKTIDSLDIQKKQCYGNAAQVALNCKGVDYVEGSISFMGIPIDHAWNKIDDLYFDVTADIALNGKSNFKDYTSTLNIDTHRLMELMVSTETYGPYLSNVYRESLKKSIHPGLIPHKKMTKDGFMRTYHERIDSHIKNGLKRDIKEGINNITVTGDKHINLKLSYVNKHFKDYQDLLGNLQGQIKHIFYNKFGTIIKLNGPYFTDGYKLDGNKVTNEVTHVDNPELSRIRTIQVQPSFIESVFQSFKDNYESLIKNDIYNAVEQDLEEGNIEGDLEFLESVQDDILKAFNKYIEDTIDSQDINEYFKKSLDVDSLEKSFKSFTIGQISTHKDGKKYKKVSNTGDSKKDWKLVSGESDPKQEEDTSKKQKENPDTVDLKAVKNLEVHTKKASEQVLERAIVESEDKNIRKAALDELKRRDDDSKDDSDKILKYLKDNRLIKLSTIKHYQEHKDDYDFKVEEDKKFGNYRISIFNKGKETGSLYPSNINPLDNQTEGKAPDLSKPKKVSELISLKDIGHYNDPSDEFAQDLDEYLKESGIDWRKESELTTIDPSIIKASEWNDSTPENDNRKVEKYSKMSISTMPPIIAVKKKDGAIEAINGIHRVYAAKKIGMQVPAIVMSAKMEQALNTSDIKMEQFLLSKYKSVEMPELNPINKNEKDIESLKELYKKALEADDFDTMSKIHKELIERAKEFQEAQPSKKIVKDKRLSQDFTEDEEDAINVYVSIKYKEINKQLRDGSVSKENQKTIDLILSAMEKNKTREDIVVYRGHNGNHDGNNKAFTSTSLDKKVANNFKRGDNSRIDKIVIPKGTPIAYIGGGEKEVLLPPNWDKLKTKKDGDNK